MTTERIITEEMSKVLIIILIIFFCPVIVLAGAGAIFIIPLVICLVYFLFIVPTRENQETIRKYGDNNGNLDLHVEIRRSALVVRGKITPYKQTAHSTRILYEPEIHTVMKVVHSGKSDFGQIETGEWCFMEDCKTIES